MASNRRGSRQGQRAEGVIAGASAKPVAPTALIGVGVCQASFASFEHLFANLPGDLGAAFVVAARQHDGVQIDAVMETLNRHARMPVSVGGDGEALEQNHIYVAGRDALITVEDGHVRSQPANERLADRGTVDSLLISISECFHERSVAVVLAGLGADGTAGVAATKSCGGLAIAERLDGEEPAAEAITAAGISDLLLPIDQIPGQIANYVQNLVRVDEAGGWESLEAEAADHVARIAAILRKVTGNDFHGYKQNTFLRRVARRMQVIGEERIEAYVERLAADPQEVQHLFQDLLIGVTQFFRDPAEFELLEREAIPDIFKDKGPDDRVRVWVVGCATGEEAYSLAILLREHMAAHPAPPHVQIFATDLDARALAVARAGRYPEAIARHVSPERLMRWFVKEGETYRVSKDIREMCIFSPHNVLKDAPFSRIDLLSCRNLLIYLNADLQTRVIPIFHFALGPGGYLFLGNSENVTRHPKLFTPVDRRNRVFRRVETGARTLPDLPLGPRAGRTPDRELGIPPRRRGQGGAVGRRAEMIAERYAPAYVVVDDQGEVLHFSGRTGRYLEPAPGAASLNLLNLVHRELRLDLRAALQRAAVEGERVETPRVSMLLDGHPRAVNAVVEPVGGGEEPLALVVIFQESRAGAEGAPDAADYSDEHVARLEAELRVTKDRLQATIEELESTNEELKSSNEEYQSINEELQSANEELETSKEELQSVNEELQTVNHELASRVAELARANSDLKNLLESTQIATVFLDNDLRVRSFTPASAEVFHLVDTDVNRSIGHIAARVVYPELQEDARKVIKTLRPVEREVGGTEGDRRFMVRVLPYRSVDNFIAGAVITFTDITAAARAETALRASETRYRALFESMDEGYVLAEVLFDDQGRPIDLMHAQANPAAERIVGLSLAGRRLSELAPDFEPFWLEIAGQVAATGEPVRMERSAGRLGKWFDFYMFRPGGPQTRQIAVVFQDVTERKHSEQRLKLLMAELQHRVRNILSVVRSIARRSAASSESVEDYAAHLDGRLNALARTQAAVTRDPEAGLDLEQLVGEELLAYASRDNGQVKLSGPKVRLTTKPGESMALAVHELATNSVKYGALSADSGKIAANWSVDSRGDGPWLRFEWKETGKAINGGPPRRRGFGTELLEKSLAYELGARTALDFKPGAFRCTIEFPLKNRMVE